MLSDHSTSVGSTPSATQPFDHAQRPGGVAGERAFTKLEYVESRAVGNAGEHVFDGHPICANDHAELLQLLVRGEQVAFGALGDDLQRVVVDIETQAFRANTAASRRGGDVSTGHTCNQRPMSFHGPHPFGALSIPIELRRGDHQHAIAVTRFEQRNDGRAAGVAGLARRHAYLDDAPLGKQ